MSVIPQLMKISICLSRIFFPNNSTNPLGLSLVKGLSLFPSPAARIIAFKVNFPKNLHHEIYSSKLIHYFGSGLFQDAT